jgi:hypothetical protein
MSWFNHVENIDLPCSQRPAEFEIRALPDDMRQYLEDIERNVEDLHTVVNLLREMDVFPDMLNRIDALQRERKTSFAARQEPNTPDTPGF